MLTNPKSLLDIGVGFGKYGFLSREYLELCDGREEYNDWKRRIDGIEAFPEYITPAHDFIYDHIYKGKATDILPSIEVKYDLILLIDIIEHFDCEDGIALIKECLAHSRNVIISTPKDIGTQQDAFDNPFEAHKFQWRKKHFRQFGDVFFVNDHFSIVSYIGRDAQAVKKAYWVPKIKLTIHKYFPFISIPYKAIKTLFRP
jgi:hypothetical protein